MAGVGPVPINKKSGKLPVSQLSTEGGIFPGWRDANTVEFGSGATYFAHDLASETADTSAIDLEIQRGSLATGTVAITNARILTMEDHGVGVQAVTRQSRRRTDPSAIIILEDNSPGFDVEASRLIYLQVARVRCSASESWVAGR